MKYSQLNECPVCFKFYEDETGSNRAGKIYSVKCDYCSQHEGLINDPRKRLTRILEIMGETRACKTPEILKIMVEAMNTPIDYEPETMKWVHVDDGLPLNGQVCLIIARETARKNHYDRLYVKRYLKKYKHLFNIQNAKAIYWAKLNTPKDVNEECWRYIS